MAQYVSTEMEELEQVATNRGWSDFCDWGRALEVEAAPSVHHLIEYGYDNDPGMLLDELESALTASRPGDDVRSTAQGLIDFLHEHRDAEIILVSNGMTSDRDEDEEDEDDDEDDEDDEDEDDEEDDDDEGDDEPEGGADRALGRLHRGGDRGGESDLDAGGAGDVVRRLHPGRALKASSAESILALCLRRTGLSAAYRHGELTGPRALEVLEAVRQYAREWMRHEAEQLIRVYGGAGSRSLSASMRHHVGRFFERARQFVREAILAGTMALSGSSELSRDDLDEAERQARGQAAYLEKFEADVLARPPMEIAEPSGLALAGPMTAAEFAARAESYGNSPWGAAHTIVRKRVVHRPGTMERRIHTRRGPHAECQTCISQSERGWVPAGTLLDIGDSECQGHCDCTFQFRAPGGEVYYLGEKIPA